MQIFYGLLAALDWIVYKIAASAFRVIFEIVNKDFFTETQISDIKTRVYLILGVLILFEVVISAVQYLVNPDKFEDKEKGFGGLLKKTVITIILIVIVPVIFDFAMSIQTSVVKTIPAIIFGTEASQTTNDDKIGDKLAFTVLSSFVKARENKGGSVGSNPSNKIHDIDTFRDNVTAGCPTFSTVGMENCQYDYMIIVSTLGGLFLCYILLSMALDIAVRTIKLGLIQILSPIPISTYIFGKEKFNKFVKMSLQVYADLFIRMAIVYVIIFAFNNLVDSNILNMPAINGGVSDTTTWITAIIVNIMLIFGLLMFASKAPKFLSDLLGLPETTSGDMADMFKPAWRRVGGLSGAAAAIGAYRNAIEYGEKRGLAVRRALTGGAHAMVSRLRDVASGKSLEESYKSSREAAMARTNRNLEYRNRYRNPFQRHAQIWQERFDAYTGVTSGGKRTNATIEAANNALKARGDIWARAEQKVMDVHGHGFSSTVTYAATGEVFHLDELLTRIDILKSKGGAATPADEALLNWLQSERDGLLGKAKQEYIFKHLASASGDGKMRNEFALNMQNFLRSGGDLSEIGIITKKTLTNVIDPNTGVNYGTVEIDIGDVISRISRNEAVAPEQAAALSQYIKSGLEADAGGIRRRAEDRRTTVPKE